MSIIVCDYCGEYVNENEIFYEKVRCVFINDDEVYPQQVIQRLCEKCEALFPYKFSI